MDTNVWIGLASILVGGMLGGIGVYVTIKSRFRGRINFVVERSIGLVHSVVRNLPDLSISYKGEDVTERLVLITGLIFNSGNKDISERMVKQGPTLTLPEGFKWLEAEIDSEFSDVEATRSINGESLSFDFELLKPDEKIRFQALAEVAPNDPSDDPMDAENDVLVGEILIKNISVEERIEDTQKSAIVELSDIEEFSASDIILPIILILLLIVVGAITFIAEERVMTLYEITNEGGEKITVKAIPQNDGTLKLIDASMSGFERFLARMRGEETYESIVKFEEFYKQGEWTGVLRPTGARYVFVWIYAGLAWVPGIGVFVVVLARMRNRRIIEIGKMVEWRG